MPFKKGRKKTGGKKKGSKHKKTIEKEIIENEFKDRILLNIQEFLNAQMNIAKGASYLYKIIEEKSSKGKVLRKRHQLVTDPEEIKEVLDECEGTGVLDHTYYYITTKTPDNRALDSLIDRVFGKPQQQVNINAQIEEKQIRELVLTTRKIIELNINVPKQDNNRISKEPVYEQRGESFPAHPGPKRDI